MYLGRSLCTLYLLACQVSYRRQNSGLCCLCDAFRRLINSLGRWLHRRSGPHSVSDCASKIWSVLNVTISLARLQTQKGPAACWLWTLFNRRTFSALGANPHTCVIRGAIQPKQNIQTYKNKTKRKASLLEAKWPPNSLSVKEVGEGWD